MSLTRKKPLTRGQPPKRTGRIKAKPRTAKERARVYGTPEHQEFLRAHGCVCCTRRPVELHHVRNGGMGKKSGAANLVPLCTACHYRLHQTGTATLEHDFAKELGGKTLREWATRYASAWTKLAPKQTTKLTPLSAIVPGVVKAMTEGDE